MREKDEVTFYVVRLWEFVTGRKICRAGAIAGGAAPSPARPAPPPPPPGKDTGWAVSALPTILPTRGQRGRCWRAVDVARRALCPGP